MDTTVRGGRLLLIGSGAAAGLLAGLLAAALVAVAGGPAQLAGMAGMAGMASTDAAAAWLASVVPLSALMGIVYVWLFPPAAEARSGAEHLMAGALLGLGYWLVLPVSALPALMGQGPRWQADAVAASLPVLLGSLAQGALTGAGCSLLYRAAVRVFRLPAAAPSEPPAPVPPAVRHRILILGGGFAGATTAQHLEERFGDDDSVAITLVSSDNSLLFTPMLSEVTAGGVEAQHIGPPLRAFFRRVDVVRGEAAAVNLQARVVRLAPDGPAEQRELPFDHLVLALGTVPNFFGNQNVQEHAFTFKSLGDAILLRNHVIDLLEQADAEPDPAQRRALLTFVVAGGGFAGAELIGGLNDFVRGSLWYYPNVAPEGVSFVLVHPGERILPELSAPLAEYAREKMGARGVDFRLGVRLADAGPDSVLLNNGETIRSHTLVWTAGNMPHPLLRQLGVALDRRGSVVTDATMAVAYSAGATGNAEAGDGEAGGASRVWALGDCAAVPNEYTGQTAPPTAQHALREAKTLAHNIHATITGRPPKPFRFRAIGTLAVLGHQTACAEIYGVRFSGLFAWWLWRAIYLGKLPTLEKRVRVALDWTVDLFFPRDITRVDVPQRAGSAPAAGGRTIPAAHMAEASTGATI